MSRNDEILTDEDCAIALRNYTKTNDAKLVSVSIERLGSIDGFVGQHFKVEMQYENDGEKHSCQLFLKVLSSSFKFIFDIGMSMDAYVKEEFLYDFLLKEFHTNNIDTSFAPKLYMCRPYMLLLEDISRRGYKITPKKEMLNIEHCKVALKSLAKYHSSAIIYEEMKSKERGSSYSLLEAYPTKFVDKVFSESSYSKWFKYTIEGILKIIRFLPETEITADMFINKLVNEIETFSGLSKVLRKYRNTIIHGDLWSNNIMFRYEDEAPVHAILIDYQMLEYGTPAMDVVELILKNVRRHLRSECYDELLMYYYENFRECLDNHGIKAGDILTVRDFLKSCDDVRLMKKVLATAAHSVTFLVENVIEGAFDSDEGMEKLLYHGRSREITSSYNNNELFREILEEDLIEVRDTLFCK